MKVQTDSLAPFAPSYVRDPYPAFQRMRAGGDPWFAEDLGLWVVSRHEQVRAILADASTFSNALTLAPVLPICPQAGEILGGLDVDPVTAAGDAPEHTRTRRALMVTFPSTPRRAAAYEPMIRALADRLVDAMTERADADLVRDFTWELPVQVIMTLIGAPAGDFERIKRWSDGQIALIWGSPDEAEQVRLAANLVDFWRYCRELVARRVGEPGDDVVSELLAYRGGDDTVLTEREIASIAFNLLVAGHETTSNLISNGAFHLLTSGRWADLVADPGRIPHAVEEILRYDPPILGWLRNTTRTATVGGVEIPAGQRLLLLLGSANRDEHRFTDGERFDIDRADAAEHLSFGLGRHFCVGAGLARVEATVAFETLVHRLPGLRLPDGLEPRYVPNVGFRVLQTLPVTW
jgi:cytochrome P450